MVENKEFSVSHIRNTQDRFLDYIILPLGYKHNRDVQKARRGDILRFADDNVAWIDNVITAPLKSSLTDCLCRAVYGFSIAEVLGVWQRGFKAMGNDPKMVSESECLIVFFKEKEHERE